MRLLLLFHRLAEVKAITIHPKDFTVVRQAVRQGRCHMFALDDLAHAPQHQITCQQQTAPFAVRLITDAISLIAELLAADYAERLHFSAHRLA